MSRAFFPTGVIEMNQRIHWGYSSYYVLIHALGVYGVWYAFTGASAAMVWFSIAYFFFGHLSITCGAHRLYAHESYIASKPLQYLWNLGFSAVVQGPMVWWVGKHRQHHARTDMPGDPHSPVLDGYAHAHFEWLVKTDHMSHAPTQYVKHLYRGNGTVFSPALWQSRNTAWLLPAMAAGVPLAVGVLVNDVWGAIFVGVFARLVAQYHLTWIVNSAGHSDHGEHGSARNVALLAIPTVGESFHKNHHDRPGSYRLGRHWYDIDLGYYTIVLCMWLGLAREIDRPA